MEAIGKLYNGDILIKMSQKEYQTFTRLVYAVGGQPTHAAAPDRLDGFDLSATFQVISDFTASKGMINDLNTLARELDRRFSP